MTVLRVKTQNALDEGRTLILGAQILLGAFYRTVFEPGYEKFPVMSKYLLLSGLALILIAITILIAPAPYHRIAEQGGDTEEFNRFVLQVMFAALMPFALSLGIAMYVGIRILSLPWVALLSGGAITVIALFLWYGMGTIRSQGQ